MTERRSRIFHRINPRGVAHGPQPVAAVEGAVKGIDAICERAKERIIAAVARHAQAHPGSPWNGRALVELERTVRSLYSAWGVDVQGSFRESLPKVMQEFAEKAQEEMRTAGKYQRIIGKPDVQRVQWHLNSAFDQVAMRTDKMAFDHIAQLRRIAADVIRTASLTGQTRKEVSRQLLQRAIAEIPGFQFIDRAGRKWSSKSYFEMLARTELMNAGRASYDDACAKNGQDVMMLTFSGDSCKACTRWEGHLFSLTGATPGLPTKDDLIDDGVFHPNCTHSYTAVSDYDRETRFDEHGSPLPKEEAERRQAGQEKKDLDWIRQQDRRHWSEKTADENGRQDVESEARAKAEAEAKAAAEEAARQAAKAAEEARKAEEQAKQAEEAARKAAEEAARKVEAARLEAERKAAEEAARLEKERVAREEAAKREPAAKQSEERKEESAKPTKPSVPEKGATTDKEEAAKQEKERQAAKEAAHKAHRQEQWQKAFENRRERWRQEIVNTVHGPDGHPIHTFVQKVANELVSQYTPEMAKLGKPPKVEFRKNSATGVTDEGKTIVFNVEDGGSRNESWKKTDTWLRGLLKRNPLNGILERAFSFQQVTEQQRREAALIDPDVFIKPGGFTMNYILNNTNPNYGTGKKEWRENCQRCVIAAEALARGLDVTAMPLKVNPLTGDVVRDALTKRHEPGGWPTVFKDTSANDLIQFRGIPVSIKDRLFEKMRSFGEGARGILAIKWKVDTSRIRDGHVINVMVKDGIVRFYDSQSGHEVDIDKLLINVYCSGPDAPELLRTDNREFSDLVKKCCKPRGK